MSDSSIFNVEARERAGKGAARATRRAGRVPAVLYGDSKDPLMFSLEPRELTKALHQAGFYSTVFDLKLDGKSHRALARDVQFHPVTDVPLHVDFLRLSKGATVNVEVEVVFENETKSPGLKRGGVLNIVRHVLELVCPMDSIPTNVAVDLSGLDIGDSVHISQISLPENVEPSITDRDFTIATIAAPSALKQESEDEEGEEDAGEEDEE
ncbi:MAG: 50S ribosomal protein L25/general stress protein Ctc [Magnetospiraceae bacterium]